MQMVFQDPYASLNPRQTISEIIGTPFAVHRTERDRKARVRDLMSRVGLNPEHYNRYPHEFSGGQRQRVGVARALAAAPQADRLRRAGVIARRLRPGPDPQPPAKPPGRPWLDVSVHLPRSRCCQARIRSRRRDVPRPHWRRGPSRGRVRDPETPLYGVAPLGASSTDSNRRLAACRPTRGRTLARSAAARLPLPSTVSQGPAAGRRRRSAPTPMHHRAARARAPASGTLVPAGAPQRAANRPGKVVSEAAPAPRAIVGAKHRHEKTDLS